MFDSNGQCHAHKAYACATCLFDRANSEAKARSELEFQQALLSVLGRIARSLEASTPVSKCADCDNNPCMCEALK